MPSRQGQIASTLNSYSHLFVDKREVLPQKILHVAHKKGSNTENYYIPDMTALREAPRGLELIDGVGIISIMELYDTKKNEITEYIYRFISKEYLCTTIHPKDAKESDKNFHFHYDKSEAHEPHISVIHPTLRYHSDDIRFDTFLEFIQDHFYKWSDGKLIKKSGYIWENKLK